MVEIDNDDEHEQRRPVGMVLLGGLYLFFFMLTISTYGHPFPFFGVIYQGKMAEYLVFADSLVCLYLFLGLMKRQNLTWFLLLGYNAFELANTLTNLFYITTADLEKVVGEKVDPQGILTSNISVMVAILLLSIFIYRHREYFTNRSWYLF
ncbi:MAG: hypothetical protein GJV46_06290 [Geobacter sp.]|nr:hypothetical protein [Geobacter sp.]